MNAPTKLRGIGRWMGLCVAVGVMLGCAPEKPSDADARDLEVDAEQMEQLDDPEAVVARIGGEEITRQQFDRRIEGLVDFARARLQSEERREQFLERIVEFEVMAGQAQQMGFGDHPRVRQAVQTAAVELMIEDHLRGEVSMADVDDDARTAYFEEHIDEFHSPERRRLARLVVDDEERADELLQRWEDKEIGEDDEPEIEFRRFAFLHSEERDTGDEGGDAGWTDPSESEVYGEDVFDWEFARVYGPFEDNGQFVLKMVIEIEEADEPTVDELQQQLTERVYEKRRTQTREAFVDTFTSDAQVEIYEERLGDIEPPPKEAPPRLDELPRGSD